MNGVARVPGRNKTIIFVSSWPGGPHRYMENRRSDRMSSGEFFLECRRLRRVYRLGVVKRRRRERSREI